MYYTNLKNKKVLIGEECMRNEDVCLVVEYNIFYGAGLQKILKQAVETVQNEKKAVIFENYVNDPERYGVAEFDQEQHVISLEEKPQNPKSNYAVVGLYFYPNSVIDMTKQVKPSNRGELEITSVNQIYLDKENPKTQIFSRGFAWLATGTHEALTEATEFVKAVEKRTGLKIASLEEIAINYNWIDKDEVHNATKDLKGEYFEYLYKITSK
ncbi:glucose-1-phosphate thymidylyltransferase [Gillisia sp. Hel_I_86]|nr:glucose-1-phosphate thymidylyltransferase [Gillisia sp. Hel_I_86]